MKCYHQVLAAIIAAQIWSAYRLHIQRKGKQCIYFALPFPSPFPVIYLIFLQEISSDNYMQLSGEWTVVEVPTETYQRSVTLYVLFRSTYSSVIFPRLGYYSISVASSCHHFVCIKVLFHRMLMNLRFCY